ncbi:PadR family transcriptional regulator [Streptomyces sp. SID13666]|uniref:PadR family transcriptional regulator n=1 Tax=unclassified Streptomyces TaxID=2593676 RepID=UPI0013C0A512|nr:MULTISPECIES: PadR family transcriptional regulator [unclassified Streptomyces]NEA57639.1 PadR family transcriptional regulator [Streptomyces sp. SID13666]NEA73981.1 PadR family transcriptional regulator [Streptomyces sp. SID13588]
MSIRHGLLALLDRGPRYGFQLRTEFESRTGSTWPLNVGQVYTTLGRLERDGLVVPAGEDDGGHALYAITDEGRSELRTWFSTPVDRANPPRNELAIKLAMAVGSSDIDIRAVIQAQRHHTLQALQDYTRLKAQALVALEQDQNRDDVAWLLVIEQLIFQAEAEARWLDHAETRLVRLADAVAADKGGVNDAKPNPNPNQAPNPNQTPKQEAAHDKGLRAALARSRPGRR